MNLTENTNSIMFFIFCFSLPLSSDISTTVSKPRENRVSRNSKSAMIKSASNQNEADSLVKRDLHYDSYDYTSNDNEDYDYINNNPTKIKTSVDQNNLGSLVENNTDNEDYDSEYLYPDEVSSPELSSLPTKSKDDSNLEDGVEKLTKSPADLNPRDGLDKDIGENNDYYDIKYSTPYNINTTLSEVIGKRVNTDLADSVLKSYLNKDEYHYSDWKLWVLSDDYQIFCRSDSDCSWIAKKLRCYNITFRETKASWFDIGIRQNLGECACPNSFDLGFSWNAQTCIKTEEQWTIIVMSLVVCLTGTILLLLIAHIQDILVAYGLRKRSLPTPTNSSIGRYPSVQK